MVGNGRTGRKLCVYLKVMMDKEGTSEAEGFLRKQIKASAQRSEVGGDSGKESSFSGKFNSHFLLNVNDSLGKNYLKYIVNDVARILPDHVN